MYVFATIHQLKYACYATTQYAEHSAEIGCFVKKLTNHQYITAKGLYTGMLLLRLNTQLQLETPKHV